MNHRTIVRSLALLSALSLAGSAWAEEVAVSSGSPPASGNEPGVPHVEASLFGGALFLSKDHELFKQHHEPFKSPAPVFGARFGVFPVDFVGIEGEVGAGPAKTETDVAAGVWLARGQLVGQLPGRLSPFAVVGIGALGAQSNVTGSDKDTAVHFGLGVKYWFDHFLGFRLDLRDTVAPKHLGGSASAQTHNPEILLGLSFALDAKAAPEPPPPDQDADGVVDEKDK